MGVSVGWVGYIPPQVGGLWCEFLDGDEISEEAVALDPGFGVAPIVEEVDQGGTIRHALPPISAPVDPSRELAPHL